MATWKEKGVVPDSDDEDDLESQSIASERSGNSRDRFGGAHGADGDVVEDGNNTEDKLEGERTYGGCGGFHEDDNDDDELPTLKNGILLAGSVTPPTKYTTLSPSSPSSPRVFIVPQLLLELEEDSVLRGPEKKLDRDIITGSGHESTDEISRSYVRITSATSSPLSSPPTSQPILPPSPHSNKQLEKGTGESDDASNHSGLSGINFEDFGGPIIAKRSLRHRNLNQLYPYQLELEKYKRELKGRGIAPTMIAESQEERYRVVASPDPDSQSFDAQERESEGGEVATEESQQMDFAWYNPTSSSVPRPAADDNHSEILNRGSLVSDDEEFPDIDELIRQRPVVPSLPSTKRRLKLYSTKSKRPPLSDIQSHSTARTHTVNFYDIPASPPATSPPFSGPAIWKPMSRATPTSSKAPSPSRLAFSERNIRETTDLPTPATSAAKPAPIFIDSDLEDEDPLANDPDETTSASESSSDESVQLRRVGKKIRGVLPASHLRLDLQQKKPVPPSHLRRASLSVSPAKVPIRRGVALPRAPRDAESPSVQNNTSFLFLEDASEEDNSEHRPSTSLMGSNTRSEGQSLFNQSRMGFAEEDDTIDAMLPSRKRQSKLSNTYRRKKRRIGSELYKNQPKITDHLKVPRQSNPQGKISQPTNPSLEARKRKHSSSSRIPRFPAAPRLSILDVTNFQSRKDLPRFIRIAARTAMIRSGQGRQSPSRKFIRLANREDTSDAQSVLQDWREGRIPPTDLEVSRGVLHDVPLRRIEDNQQTRLRSPVQKARSARPRPTGHSGMPRKLVVSNGAQRSMNDFVFNKEPPIEVREHLLHNRSDSGIQRRHQESYRNEVPTARPAQLESTGVEYSRRYPAASFRSSKKFLDTLYRASRKRSAPRANLQLSRFLADEDTILPLIETSVVNNVSDNHGLLASRTVLATKIPQSKKRLPRRIDAGAAIYRQPSDPLILEFLPTTKQISETDRNKLLGLGKYGTNYPISFDIFPLQPGVFFHESTFIGSGQLSKFMRGDNYIYSGDVRPSTSLMLGSKDFRWGLWDENVSSEIGVCFDWILDQVCLPSSPTSSPQTTSVLDVLNFVQGYVQYHISFTEPLNLDKFLSRMVEVLHDFLSRLDTYATTVEYIQVRRCVEILERCTLLAFQLLLLSQPTPEQTSLTFRLEVLLKNVAGKFIGFLLSLGLERIRKLYDDLQYLSFRERGIRSDQYVAQAWVIVIRVLSAARIPRGTFWDVANSQLMGSDGKDTGDARVMEKLWYSLFSLLPLSEFDEFGVIIPGTRHQASFENWTLPQQMLKRVFAVYGSNPRQSPSFNDYCRAIVSRCHHLMIEWGWWRCSGVIGTLFDFFASQNLAHLRNEEVYASPHFLEELHEHPSLAVEPEDRCFHIFLKMVALQIKHLHQLNDTKSVRNLVARLLPNHDRQYPKEEAIHHRDLASLRNHHDLLCTLFWAAPAQQRPSPSLIQELVAADHSHKEACLINVRAWGNLARFVVTTHPTSDALLPFTNWGKILFDKLWQQYLNIEPEVRAQAQSIATHHISGELETYVRDTVRANKQGPKAALSLLIKTMACVVTDAGVHTSLKAARDAFEPALIVPVLEEAHCDDLTSDVVFAMERFVAQIEVDQKRSSPPAEDSQDGLGINMDQWEAIHDLKIIILPPLSRMLKDVLQRTSKIKKLDTLVCLYVCWAKIVSLIAKDGQMKLYEFLAKGPHAIFQTRHGYEHHAHLWATALSVMVEKHNSLDSFVTHQHSAKEKLTGIPDFDIGREWLVLLTKANNATVISSADNLGAALWKKSHYLLPYYNQDNPVAQYIPLSPAASIRFALNYMRRFIYDPYGADISTGLVSPKTAKVEFSKTLKSMMESMKSELEKLSPGSKDHVNYVTWVQGIIAAIRAFASDIQPVSEFFLHSSPHYWPQSDDPNLFGAGILSYSLQLAGKDSKKASSQLFHFLLNGFRQSFLQGQIRQYQSHIKTAMKNWELVEFFLKEFLPVGVRIGFEFYKWVIGWVFLPIVSSRIVRLLEKNDGHAASTFKYVLNLLGWIRNGMCIRQQSLGIEDGVLLELNGILAVTTEFWLAVKQAMISYSQLNDGDARIMLEYECFFQSFLNNVGDTMAGDHGQLAPLEDCEPTEGFFFEPFMSATKSEMEMWDIDLYDRFVDIKSIGVRGDVKRIQLNRKALSTILAGRYRASPQPQMKDPKPFYLNLFG